MSSPQLKKSIANYYETRRLYSAHHLERESSVRQAFLTLLDATARPYHWTLSAEHDYKAHGGRPVRPDATLLDQYTLPRGYYEAKDIQDDLTREIRKKLHLGYPATNTIFEDNRRAVLFQNEVQALDIDLENEKALVGLLDTFYHHRRPDIDGFENAIATFQQEIPKISNTLAAKITSALSSQNSFREVFETFLDTCRQSLNPDLRPEAVQEMLVQHLLTERLIRRIFDYDDFVRHNVIAAEVENVIESLSSRDFTRARFLRDLDPYYKAIESTADTLTAFEAKQHFLDRVYEKFFQAYSRDTADTHGIVYTPPEIVRYMCQSVANVLEQEFDRPLGSPGTYILDPCTGTGNFIAHLIQDFIPRRHLERMYTQQLFANEVMLMPYYIASLNIEHAYYEKMGDRRPFEGLCFVDSLDMAEDHQMGLFTPRNSERVNRLKKTPINVIIGNPPYNVGQKSENDNNKNRKYPVLDRRIRETYSADSAATSKSKLNDAYVKFFRWASDRIGSQDGILCFVTNNGFLEQHAFDGMRKHLSVDFTSIDHIDLHGNIRKNPKLSGTTHNVFGIQVGVGITLAIRKSGSPRRLRYHRVPELWTKQQKLNFLASTEPTWTALVPSDKSQWIIPANLDEFAESIPIESLFDLYSLGVCTHRDNIVYDFHRGPLEARVRQFIEHYNAELHRYQRAGRPASIDEFVDYTHIKWSRDLKLDLQRGSLAEFDESKMRNGLYRPFTKRWLFFDRILNEEVYQLPVLFPTGEDCPTIALTGIASDKPFLSIATASIPDLHLVGAAAGCQCFPLSRFSNEGLGWFQSQYQEPHLSKLEVFHFIYASLHHPTYRERYAGALKKELPRIPFAPDFRAFQQAGAKLMDLHIHYEEQPPFKLSFEENLAARFTYELQGKMKFTKDRRAIVYNEALTLAGIPQEAFNYRLGHRSAVEWIIDQYQLKKDNQGRVTSNPFRPEDPEYIVNLIGRVITVSLETNRIVAELAKLPFRPD